MKPFSKTMRGMFKKWGSEGGKKRGKSLSPAHRSWIASRAACARWGGDPSSRLKSVRLLEPRWDEPVFIEEILSDGGLPEWRELYRRITNFPFGETANALEKVVHSVDIYGATNLWRSLLKNYRGGADG